MQRGSRLVDDERGMALIMAIGIMLVLAISLGAVVALSSGIARHASRSNADQKAYSLAEAGVSDGASVLAGQARPDTWPNYASLTTADRTLTIDGNTAFWSATGPTSCGSDCARWTISATSTVKNPTGPGAAAVSRTVSKQFQVDATPGSFGIGTSFLYGKGDINLTGGSATEEAIITDGNFVQSGSGASVDAAASALSVRGTIDAGTSQDFIGDGIETTLTVAMTNSQTTATVASTADFPATGWIKIFNEYMTYTGKTATSFTGLTRGAFLSVAAAHTTTSPDNIVSGSVAPTLTAAMTATQNFAKVTSTKGFRASPPSSGLPAGLVKIPNASNSSVEYITYTGLVQNSGALAITDAICGSIAPGQGCFKGMVRGYVPGYPADSHTTGTTVDGRIQEIHTIGGCISGGNCSQVESAAPIDANLLQDDPAFVIPTFNAAQARIDAAPGPNHQPSPACAISFATSGTSTQQSYYYNGATVDLTPSTDYDCVATSPVYGAGELKWTNATHTLKIRGVVFLPSGAKNTQDIVYDAPQPGATLYVTGKYTAGSGTGICGLRSGSTLTAPMTASQNFASIASTAGFPDPVSYKADQGVIQIDNEQMTFTSWTPDDPATPGVNEAKINGLARGKFSTTAAAHSSGAAVGETAACDLTNWNPNTGSNLALVGPNLPAGVTNTIHDFTFGGGAAFQGLIYTDGSLTISGGGILSGTAFAMKSPGTAITYSGGAAAPAPGILSLPFGFPSSTTYTVSYVEGTSSG